VKSLGDGLLLEFATVAQAVGLARSLQALLNKVCDKPPRLAVRAGVHVADVLVDDLDIYGAGVNLAARLCTLAGPGEVVGSAEVRDALTDGVEAEVTDLGNCYLKHVQGSVRAFRLSGPASAAAVDPERVDLELAIAVVPFAPLDSGAQAAWALGDAIADATNASLARCPGVRVVSRLSCGALRQQPDILRACREHLRASFVLSGSYRLDGQSAWLIAELSDARDGSVAWAGHRKVLVDEVFAGTDPHLGSMVGEITRAVIGAELRRMRGLPLPTLDSFSLYVGGLALLHRMRQTDFTRAREVLEALHERQPRHAAPLALLGKWHLFRMLQGWAPDRGAEGRMAHDQTRRALEIEADNALALAVDALLSSHADGDLVRARLRAEEAVIADPQETLGWLALSGVECYEGNGIAAAEHARRAIDLSPLDPKRFMFDLMLGAGELTAGDYRAAISRAQTSLRLNALHAPTHRLHTIALALGGELDRAREAAVELLRIDPSFTLGTFEARYPGRAHSHARRFVEALRQAGIPP
jgi:TolB-like protein